MCRRWVEDSAFPSINNREVFSYQWATTQDQDVFQVGKATGIVHVSNKGRRKECIHFLACLIYHRIITDTIDRWLTRRWTWIWAWSIIKTTYKKCKISTSYNSLRNLTVSTMLNRPRRKSPSYSYRDFAVSLCMIWHTAEFIPTAPHLAFLLKTNAQQVPKRCNASWEFCSCSF